MLQPVNGNNTVSRTSVYECYKRFKEEREEVKENSLSGRPSTYKIEVNVEKVRQLVCDDRLLSVRMMANQFSMKKDSVWKSITKDLGMFKK